MPMQGTSLPASLLSIEPFDRSMVIDIYETMLAIRHLENEIERLFLRGLVRGSTHLCQGQEAVSTGACRAMSDGDTMTCTYRGHGAVLAAGAAVERVLAEMLGKGKGLSGGLGGSMHLADLSIGAMGSFAIVGANLPIAAGLAWGHQLAGNAASIAFFGDGSTNIGAFHETLNIARVWNLPLVFVCENNLYGEYSPIAATTAVTDLAERARAYGIPSERIDGNDVFAVTAAVKRALDLAREGGGPTFLEALTYRHKGHSRSDPGTYRPQEEVTEWLARDPITRLRDWLVTREVLTQEAARETDERIDAATRAASNEVLDWEEPSADESLTAVWQ